MLAKRIIPCLDVRDGRTVKGTNFVGLRDAGDPVEQAEIYSEEGADELVFLDITATIEGRQTFYELIRKIAQRINIPFTVGGGINSVEDIKPLLDAGADKVSINSAAYRIPGLISEAAGTFGSQCIVAAIDLRKTAGGWEVFLSGGREATGTDGVKWIKTCAENGAGEILLTSMDADGTKNGFDLKLNKLAASVVNVPVIASGGAGAMSHFSDLFKDTEASAGLAASIFHFGEIRIGDLKEWLCGQGIEVR